MGNFKMTTVEEMEAATNRLLETGAKVGADAWQFRVKNQTPHCKFGEQGVCCRICSMGPCRSTPKAPRGIGFACARQSGQANNVGSVLCALPALPAAPGAGLE